MLNRNFKTIMLGWFMSSQGIDNNKPRFQTQTIYNIGSSGEGAEFPPTDAGTYDREDVSACIINGLNQLTTTNTIARQQSVNRLFMAVGTRNRNNRSDRGRLHARKREHGCNL